MATHALTMHGHDVIVVSKKRKSEMYGAQYLHQPIPGMTEKAPVQISYQLHGTPEMYRRKVYGENLPRNTKVSVEELLGEHLGWDIRSTYDNLWDTYGDYVQHVETVEPDYLRFLIDGLQPDAVFSTIPAPVLCEDEAHSFMYEEVWAIGDAPERGVFCPIVVTPNTVVCNGDKAPAWYRAANIFNRRTAEWPADKKPPLKEVSLIKKPVRMTCTCFPSVTRLGRYGKWEKGVLSHEAFFDVQNYVTKTGVQGTLL